MDKTDGEMIHEELSGKIIGAGMDVLHELGPALDDPAAAGLRTRINLHAWVLSVISVQSVVLLRL